jgi:hypothetical protein
MPQPYKPPQTRAERRAAAREVAKLLVHQSPDGKRVRREKRDRLLTLILALAGYGLSFVGIVWASVAWFVCILVFSDWIDSLEGLSNLSNRRRLTLRVGVIAGLAVVAWFPEHHQWLIEKAAALEGDLRGAGESFNDGQQRAVPFLEVADSKSVEIMIPPKPGEQPSPYYKWYPDTELKLEFGKKGPMMSTTVRDSQGNVVVDVKQNHWIVYPPYCLDKNYTQDVLEVKDSGGHVALQVRLLPDRVQVQGEWWDNQHQGVRVVALKGQAMWIPLGPLNQHLDELIIPIFKYPSKSHWREFMNG